MVWAFSAAIAAYYLWTVFSVPPFIEQEVVVQANYWVLGASGFLEKLFEPGMNDGGPGRFRYVDYLITAAYWRLTAVGFLPRDLYDYFAIVINLGVGLGILLWARRAKLPVLYQSLVTATWILSSQAFHSTVWHYRKAKLLVSVWLLLLVWLFRQPEKKRTHLLLGVLVVVGFFTDPYWIVSVPVMVFLYEGIKLTPKVRTVVGAFLLSVGILVLLNGWIGPRFNARCQLWPEGIQDPSGTLLTASNAFQFYDIFPDLFAPLWVNQWGEAGGLFCFIILFSFSVFAYRQKKWQGLSFFALLPVFAFLVKPDSQQATYAGYYGHALLALLLIGMVDWLSKLKNDTWQRVIVTSGFLLTIFFHQLHREEAYLLWRMGHLGKQVTAQKFWRDYLEMKNIAAYLKLNRSEPYRLTLDSSRLQHVKMEAVYEKRDRGDERQRTTLAYLLIPAIFSQEVSDGKVVIRRE